MLSSALAKKGPGADKHLFERFPFLYIVHIDPIIASGGVDHHPTAQADADMRDASLAAALAEEEQVACFEGRFHRSGSGVLQIGIARHLNSDPFV